MITVSLKTRINASATQVWETVGDFNGLPKFVEAATHSRVDGEGVGARRTISLPDGAEIVEKLESMDVEGKAYSYSIVSGPLPVEGYVANMKLKAVRDNECEFEWSSTFEPKGASEAVAREAIEGVYQMGFAGLKKLYPNPA
jgi:hypothetical protein